MLMWWFSQVPNLVIFGGVVVEGGLFLEGDGGVAHHLRSITRADFDCRGLGWVQGDCVFHALQRPPLFKIQPGFYLSQNFFFRFYLGKTNKEPEIDAQ